MLPFYLPGVFGTVAHTAVGEYTLALKIGGLCCCCVHALSFEVESSIPWFTALPKLLCVASTAGRDRPYVRLTYRLGLCPLGMTLYTASTSRRIASHARSMLWPGELTLDHLAVGTAVHAGPVTLVAGQNVSWSA